MAEEQKEVQEEQLVIFEVANEICGVNISTVQEIIRMQPITGVPRAPEFVEGVINLRGKVIPVIDLRERFGFEKTEETKSTRIVVVEVENNTVGMIVDAVAEVLRLPTAAIEPPSPVVETVDSEYMRGIGKVDERLIILLDLEKVLTEIEKGRLKQVKETAEVK